MKECIFDRNESCREDCVGCGEYRICCDTCGAAGEELYDICGEIFCLDCLVNELGSEFYADFAKEHCDEFRSFCAEMSEENCLH